MIPESDEFDPLVRKMVRNAINDVLDVPECSNKGQLDVDEFASQLEDRLAPWLRGVVRAAFDCGVMVMPGF